MNILIGHDFHLHENESLTPFMEGKGNNTNTMKLSLKSHETDLYEQ